MIEKSKRIGVLMGGLSTEYAVSMKSGHAVSSALRERGWDVVEIVVDRSIDQKIREAGIDVAWLALHGRFGEDGCIQGLLEVMGIPYTGSGVRASAVAMDKIATKRALVGEVTQARDWVVRREETIPLDVRLPAVVKPAVGGSTIGIKMVDSTEKLFSALAEAFALHGEVLVEEFVAGEEITVAVFEGHAFPVVRILPDSGFFDYEAKYTSGRTTYEVPAAIPESTAKQAQAEAVRAYQGLGCRGLCRADFIVREDGTAVFLEINSLPGMTATSLSPMAASAEGVSFPELVERVLHSATVMASER